MVFTNLPIAPIERFFMADAHKQRSTFSVLRSRLICISLLLVLAGCGAKAKDEPDLAAVSGKVTLDGTPVQSGNIAFLPDESKGTKGPASTAIINDKGEYTLMSSGGRSGAIVGHHKVALECPQAGSSSDGNSGGSPAVKCNIPAKYRVAETSGLTANVTAGKPNTIDFDLKSK